MCINQADIRVIDSIARMVVGERTVIDMNKPEPSSCPFYNGITKCTVFNCMFNVFGVCTKSGSKFKGDKADDTDEF